MGVENLSPGESGQKKKEMSPEITPNTFWMVP